MSLHGVVVPAPKYISGTPETSARPSCNDYDRKCLISASGSYIQVNS